MTYIPKDGHRRGAEEATTHQGAPGGPGSLRWVVPMMTHKYRGSIIVLSIRKSVKPNEEQKEMISSFQ